jgi:hypothetical protein
MNLIPNRDWGYRDKASGETTLQRLDRNFGEILQELRVAQTGTQILFAFLLTLTFTDRFHELTEFQLRLYVITLSFAFIATGLLIGPVAYHRLTFRRRMRLQLVKTANILAILGLIFLALALTSSVLLVTDMALDDSLARWLTAIGTFWLATLWFLLPIFEMIRYEPPEIEDGDEEDED